MAVLERVRNTYRVATGRLGFCEKCWGTAKVSVDDNGRTHRYCQAHFQGRQADAAGRPHCENCGVEVRNWPYGPPGWRAVTCDDCGSKLRPEDDHRHVEDEPETTPEDTADDHEDWFEERTVDGKRRLVLTRAAAARLRAAANPEAFSELIEQIEDQPAEDPEELPVVEDVEPVEDIPEVGAEDPEPEMERVAEDDSLAHAVDVAAGSRLADELSAYLREQALIDALEAARELADEEHDEDGDDQ